MRKKLFRRTLPIFVIFTAFATASVSAVTLAWFVGPNIDSQDSYLDGKIGLRNYFHAGDGSEEKPYEIVQPVHFYNLVRLQNLGIFPKKTYFQIGSIFDIDGTPSLRCISGYDENNDPIYTDYLDMGAFSSSTRILTIGGEATPFVSEIDGKGLPIRNLKVYGNPEDVGVFGYVAQGGKLKNLVFDNLEVTSLGYNNTSGADDNQLFSENIDDIFAQNASRFVTDSTLTLYDYNSTTTDYDATNLKKLTGTTVTTLANVNSSSNVVADTMYFNGYFHPTFPDSTLNPRFSYSLVSSSPILKTVGDLGLNLPGSDPSDLTFDFAPLEANIDFNKANEYEVSARIYLVASVKVDNHLFSRVIQSYSISVLNNAHAYRDGEYSVSIFCDYIEHPDTNGVNVHYHHGVNVGLIAGHVDGTIKDCYVYEGTLKFNDTGFHPIAAETDTALVGEIGKSVKNTIDPDVGLVVNGDIGVMNFSRIYSLIRKDFKYPDTTKAGQRRGSDGVYYRYISYKNYLQDGHEEGTVNTVAPFEDYLRYYDGMKDQDEYITYTSSNITSEVWTSYSLPSNIPEDFNSVSFLWNKVIEDEDGVDRGLGVFKITSSYDEGAKENPDSYGPYMVNSIDKCRIINGKTPISKVYFSTAEYDYTKNNHGYTWNDTNDIPKRATDLPSYSDVQSFNYPFSRDFNYVFELNLADMDDADGNDYMYNTDSNFLTNYLSNKLIDKYGDPVEPGTPRFGFMFRSSENELLTSLSSYMPVGEPGEKQPFESEGTTKYYPSNAIVFSIENPNGANVSVVGNGDDIGVYSYNPDVSTDDVALKYKMKSNNINQMDMHRYFTYDVASGATGTTAVVGTGEMKDSGVLYGHIFKLPKGDYILGGTTGGRGGTQNARVYFLAVQGQTEGTIGTTDIITLDDKVEDVDFLLTKPSFNDFAASLDKALFSYKGVFNTSSGTITNDVYVVNDKRYMRVTFDNTTVFVTSMHLKSRKVDHIFMFNGELLNKEEHDYTAA